MARFLVVKPLGGLANRIRAVTCGMWCAQELGMELILSWQCGDFMPAQFSELFKNDLNTDTRGLESCTKTSIGMGQLIRAKMIIDQSCISDPATAVIEICTGVAFSYRPDVSPMQREFGETIRPYLHALIPVDSVVAEVRANEQSFRERMLGVHLRTGREQLGYHKSIEITEEPFFEAIDRATTRINGLGLYVASDSRATISRFQQRYGSRVFTLTRNGEDIPRHVDSAEAIRIALVELMLLGRTHWLLGSMLSSFSEVAGWYKRRAFSAIGTRRT